MHLSNLVSWSLEYQTLPNLYILATKAVENDSLTEDRGVYVSTHLLGRKILSSWVYILDRKSFSPFKLIHQTQPNFFLHRVFSPTGGVFDHWRHSCCSPLQVELSSFQHVHDLWNKKTIVIQPHHTFLILIILHFRGFVDGMIKAEIPLRAGSTVTEAWIHPPVRPLLKVVAHFWS